MDEIDMRGGCGHLPLELTGDWTGYNNGPTKEVGLWIRHDGERIKQARRAAVQEGPHGLALHLTAIMAQSFLQAGEDEQPGAVFKAMDAVEYQGQKVDWSQIAYDLVGDEPDDDDLDAARDDLNDKRTGGDYASDEEVFEVAARRRETWAREVALGGAR